ncbi:MAG: Fe-S cluster assembly protein SufD [Gemmatimonadetes bacterium]|nr:Fe-S cluster assembly protein SufD [Gemmatimonadota bacterium]
MSHAAQARDRFLAEFSRFAGNGGARVPHWLMELRQRAIDRFAELGFPSTKQESWRFTDVGPLATTEFALPDDVPVSASSRDLAGHTLGSAARLVFVDGRYDPALSAVSGLPRGARFQNLNAAWSEAPELVQRHLAQHASLRESGFAALGTALFTDGAFLYLPPDTTIDEPFQALFLSSAGGRPRVSFPRTLVVLERGARAVFLETYASLGHGTHFTNAVTELVVEDGARLDACRLQQENTESYHVAVTDSHQGRDANLESCVVALGSLLARHDVGAVLGGQGGYLILNGLTLGVGRQHVDHHTVIDHAQPHCESHELFNGVFDDHARGVFNGRIIVRPGAQRTDSKQTNNNLLLSEDARADSQPQLEIYADDVKCTHGATLGPMDEAALFYLRSRGLGKLEARNLLTYGFGADIVSRVRAESVRSHLYPLLLERLCRQRTGAAA